jgi:hypothetical protein
VEGNLRELAMSWYVLIYVALDATGHMQINHLLITMPILLALQNTMRGSDVLSESVGIVKQVKHTQSRSRAFSPSFSVLFPLLYGVA